MVEYVELDMEAYPDKDDLTLALTDFIIRLLNGAVSEYELQNAHLMACVSMVMASCVEMVAGGRKFSQEEVLQDLMEGCRDKARQIPTNWRGGSSALN